MNNQLTRCLHLQYDNHTHTHTHTMPLRGGGGVSFLPRNSLCRKHIHFGADGIRNPTLALTCALLTNSRDRGSYCSHCKCQHTSVVYKLQGQELQHRTKLVLVCGGEGESRKLYSDEWLAHEAHSFSAGEICKATLTIAWTLLIGSRSARLQCEAAQYLKWKSRSSDWKPFA